MGKGNKNKRSVRKFKQILETAKAADKLAREAKSSAEKIEFVRKLAELCFLMMNETSALNEIKQSEPSSFAEMKKYSTVINAVQLLIDKMTRPDSPDMPHTSPPLIALIEKFDLLKTTTLNSVRNYQLIYQKNTKAYYINETNQQALIRGNKSEDLEELKKILSESLADKNSTEKALAVTDYLVKIPENIYGVIADEDFLKMLHEFRQIYRATENVTEFQPLETLKETLLNGLKKYGDKLHTDDAENVQQKIANARTILKLSEIINIELIDNDVNLRTNPPKASKKKINNEWVQFLIQQRENITQLMLTQYTMPHDEVNKIARDELEAQNYDTENKPISLEQSMRSEHTPTPADFMAHEDANLLEDDLPNESFPDDSTAQENYILLKPNMWAREDKRATGKEHTIIRTPTGSFELVNKFNAEEIAKLQEQTGISLTENEKVQLGQGMFGRVRYARRVEEPKEFVAVKKVKKDIESAKNESIINEYCRSLGLENHLLLSTADTVTQGKAPLPPNASPEQIKNREMIDTFYQFMPLGDNNIYACISEPNGARSLRAQIGNLIDDLQALHNKGVYHRDIHPKNLLSVNNRLKLVDYGLMAAYDDAGKIKLLTSNGFNFNLFPIDTSNEDPRTIFTDDPYSEKRAGEIDNWALGLLILQLLPQGYEASIKIQNEINAYNHRIKADLKGDEPQTAKKELSDYIADRQRIVETIYDEIIKLHGVKNKNVDPALLYLVEMLLNPNAKNRMSLEEARDVIRNEPQLEINPAEWVPPAAHTAKLHPSPEQFSSSQNQTSPLAKTYDTDFSGISPMPGAEYTYTPLRDALEQAIIAETPADLTLEELRAIERQVTMIGNRSIENNDLFENIEPIHVETLQKDARLIAMYKNRLSKWKNSDVYEYLPFEMRKMIVQTLMACSNIAEELVDLESRVEKRKSQNHFQTTRIKYELETAHESLKYLSDTNFGTNAEYQDRLLTFQKTFTKLYNDIKSLYENKTLTDEETADIYQANKEIDAVMLQLVQLRNKTLNPTKPAIRENKLTKRNVGSQLDTLVKEISTIESDLHKLLNSTQIPLNENQQTQLAQLKDHYDQQKLNYLKLKSAAERNIILTTVIKKYQTTLDEKIKQLDKSVAQMLERTQDYQVLKTQLRSIIKEISGANSQTLTKLMTDLDNLTNRVNDAISYNYLFQNKLGNPDIIKLFDDTLIDSIRYHKHDIENRINALNQGSSEAQQQTSTNTYIHLPPKAAEPAVSGTYIELPSTTKLAINDLTYKYTLFRERLASLNEQLENKGSLERAQLDEAYKKRDEIENRLLSISGDATATPEEKEEIRKLRENFNSDKIELSILYAQNITSSISEPEKRSRPNTADSLIGRIDILAKRTEQTELFSQDIRALIKEIEQLKVAVENLKTNMSAVELEKITEKLNQLEQWRDNPALQATQAASAEGSFTELNKMFSDIHELQQRLSEVPYLERSHQKEIIDAIEQQAMEVEKSFARLKETIHSDPHPDIIALRDIIEMDALPSLQTEIKASIQQHESRPTFLSNPITSQLEDIVNSLKELNLWLDTLEQKNDSMQLSNISALYQKIQNALNNVNRLYCTPEQEEQLAALTQEHLKYGAKLESIKEKPNKPVDATAPDKNITTPKTTDPKTKTSLFSKINPFSRRRPTEAQKAAAENKKKMIAYIENASEYLTSKMLELRGQLEKIKKNQNVPAIKNQNIQTYEEFKAILLKTLPNIEKYVGNDAVQELQNLVRNVESLYIKRLSDTDTKTNAATALANLENILGKVNNREQLLAVLGAVKSFQREYDKILKSNADGNIHQNFVDQLIQARFEAFAEKFEKKRNVIKANDAINTPAPGQQPNAPHAEIDGSLHEFPGTQAHQINESPTVPHQATSPMGEPAQPAQAMSRQANRAIKKINNLNNKLFLAIDKGNSDKVEKHLNNGADINALNKNGSSPLICALLSKNKNIAIIEELLKRNPDATIVDKMQNNAYKLAKRPLFDREGNQLPDTHVDPNDKAIFKLVRKYIFSPTHRLSKNDTQAFSIITAGDKQYQLIGNRITQAIENDLQRELNIQLPKKTHKRIEKRMFGQGAYGRVRLAREINADGTPGAFFAIKKVKARQETVFNESAIQKALKARGVDQFVIPQIAVAYTKGARKQDTAYQLFPVAQKDGSSLIAELNELPPHEKNTRLKKYAETMLTGLNALHQNHFCHQDIKPDNFLLLTDGTLRFGDLGFMRDFINQPATDYQNKHPELVGQMTHIPINYLKTNYEELSQQHDRWSLGLTLLEMTLPPADLKLLKPLLNGFKEFNSVNRSPDDMKALETKLLGSLNRLMNHLSTTDSQVAAVIKGLLNPDPTKRILLDAAIKAIQAPSATNAALPETDIQRPAPAPVSPNVPPTNDEIDAMLADYLGSTNASPTPPPASNMPDDLSKVIEELEAMISPEPTSAFAPNESIPAEDDAIAQMIEDCKAELMRIDNAVNDIHDDLKEDPLRSVPDLSPDDIENMRNELNTLNQDLNVIAEVVLSNLSDNAALANRLTEAKTHLYNAMNEFTNKYDNIPITQAVLDEELDEEIETPTPTTPEATETLLAADVDNDINQAIADARDRVNDASRPLADRVHALDVFYFNIHKKLNEIGLKNEAIDYNDTANLVENIETLEASINNLIEDSALQETTENLLHALNNDPDTDPTVIANIKKSAENLKEKIESLNNHFLDVKEALGDLSATTSTPPEPEQLAGDKPRIQVFCDFDGTLTTLRGQEVEERFNAYLNDKGKPSTDEEKYKLYHDFYNDNPECEIHEEGKAFITGLMENPNIDVDFVIVTRNNHYAVTEALRRAGLERFAPSFPGDDSKISIRSAIRKHNIGKDTIVNAHIQNNAENAAAFTIILDDDPHERQRMINAATHQAAPEKRVSVGGQSQLAMLAAPDFNAGEMKVTNIIPDSRRLKDISNDLFDIMSGQNRNAQTDDPILNNINHELAAIENVYRRLHFGDNEALEDAKADYAAAMTIHNARLARQVAENTPNPAAPDDIEARFAALKHPKTPRAAASTRPVNAPTGDAPAASTGGTTPPSPPPAGTAPSAPPVPPAAPSGAPVPPPIGAAPPSPPPGPPGADPAGVAPPKVPKIGPNMPAFKKPAKTIAFDKKIMKHYNEDFQHYLQSLKAMFNYTANAKNSKTDTEKKIQLEKIENSIVKIAKEFTSMRDELQANLQAIEKEKVKADAQKLIESIEENWNELVLIENNLDAVAAFNKATDRIAMHGSPAQIQKPADEPSDDFKTAKSRLDEYFQSPSRGNAYLSTSNPNTVPQLRDAKECEAIIYNNVRGVKSGAVRAVTNKGEANEVITHHLYFDPQAQAQLRGGRQGMRPNNIPSDSAMSWAINAVLNFKNDANLKGKTMVIAASGLEKDVTEALMIVAELHKIKYTVRDPGFNLKPTDLAARVEYAKKKYTDDKLYLVDRSTDISPHRAP